LKAILSLQDEVICWLSAEEKCDISHRFYFTYGMPNCIRIIDGTLIFLTESPEWSGEDFNTQKGGYGINTLVVYDDCCRFCIPTLDGLVQHMTVVLGEITSSVLSSLSETQHSIPPKEWFLLIRGMQVNRSLRPKTNFLILSCLVLDLNLSTSLV